MCWQTQYSAVFVNWLSIKGLLSQKQTCHVAKSSFYDAVCVVSVDLGLQEFSMEKEKHRSWSISEQFLVLQKQSDLWVNFYL